MSQYPVIIPGFRAIMFDLDGTLLDSIADIVEGCRIVYDLMGLHFDEREVRKLIGIPLKDQSRMIAGSRALEFIDTYRDVYRSLPESGLFPEAVKTLECLAAHGYRLAVVTSKLRKSAMRTLEGQSIAKFFECVITADDVSKPKPNPEPVLKALEEMGLTAQEALFVGDSIHDIRCSQAAGVAVAAVEWGAGSAEDLALECPEQQYSNWTEFTQELCKGRSMHQNGQTC